MTDNPAPMMLTAKQAAAMIAVSPATLLDVKAVASILGCSARSVYRLSDSGRMPGPVRLGAMVRWNRDDINDWLAGGCESVRHVSAQPR